METTVTNYRSPVKELTGDVQNLRLAVVQAPEREPETQSPQTTHDEQIELSTESLEPIAIKMYTAPEHRHISDVALLQISVSFFSGLRSFMEELEKTPDSQMGFRTSYSPKLDLGECLLKAKVLSKFSTNYVFTMDAPTEEDSMKRKIALDCAAVAEGFTRAVRSVTDEVTVTKDTAGFLSGMIQETAEAMRLLATQLSMTIVSGNFSPVSHSPN